MVQNDVELNKNYCLYNLLPGFFSLRNQADNNMQSTDCTIFNPFF